MTAELMYYVYLLWMSVKQFHIHIPIIVTCVDQGYGNAVVTDITGDILDFGVE